MTGTTTDHILTFNYNSHHIQLFVTLKPMEWTVLHINERY